MRRLLWDFGLLRRVIDSCCCCCCCCSPLSSVSSRNYFSVRCVSRSTSFSGRARHLYTLFSLVADQLGGMSSMLRRNSAPGLLIDEESHVVRQDSSESPVHILRLTCLVSENRKRHLTFVDHRVCITAGWRYARRSSATWTRLSRSSAARPGSERRPL